MMSMSDAELERYARACNIDISGIATKEQRVATIEERRERVEEVNILGATLAIPIKRLHDKRLSDLMARGVNSDADAALAATLLLGEEQYAELIERCTDEDGVVDVEAIGCAFVTLFTNDELKNY
jgi:hypothetical protein